MVGTDKHTSFLVALNADVVNYSKMMADEPAETADAMTRSQKLVDEQLAAANGTLVNFVGDNFMAVFDSAENAIKAAIAISTSIASDDIFKLKHENFRFRMGIARGEVMLTEGGQYLGDTLNIAARIQSIARPGGISVSGDVYLALDEPALRFRSIGSRSLKNIPEQIQVYEFASLPADNGSTTIPHRQLVLENPKVAILPMHVEGLDRPYQNYGQLLINSLVTALVREPNLDVVAVSQSDEGSAEQNPAPPGVRYMLTSGIIEMGSQVRVYAQLMEVAALQIVWMNNWDVDTDKLIELTDRFTADIVRVFEVELIVGETANIYNELKDPEAVAKVYEGWYQITSGTKEGWQKAIILFNELHGSHPKDIVGASLLAFAHWLGASERMSDDPKTDLELARRYATLGIALNDDTGMCNMVLAAIALDEGHPEAALAEVESATILRPTCDVTYALEASIRRYLGQWKKAVVLIDKAMGMTPVDKPWYPTVLASSYYIGEMYEEAAAMADEILAHKPQNLEALFVLAASQVELGLDRRAHATVQLIGERFPDANVEEWLASNPYQNKQFIKRWQNDLAAAGLSI